MPTAPLGLARPDPLPDDQDTAQRPLSLDQFVGQPRLIDQLRIAVLGARSRGEPLDHVLLIGPPGLGKTTLAGIVAAEQGSAFHSVMAPAISRPADIVALLMQLEDRAVLFIDEIHRLPQKAAEILYGAMEDRHLDITVGEGAQVRIHRIALRPFTLVGATTLPGTLSGPLLDRFGIVLRLAFYTPADLTQILDRTARLMGIAGTEDGWQALAQASRGTPRIAKRLLRRVRDYAQQANQPIDASLVETTLPGLGVNPDGLDQRDLDYLEKLADLGGGPIGLEAMATALFDDPELLQHSIEPYLSSLNLLVRTPRGRALTSMAYARLSRPVPLRIRGR